ncbi:hypothetical protein Tco_1022360 [Tanacetum coccineum]
MAVLESCPKHNMVAYLEKTDGTTEFHDIVSFLTRSSIHYALTVSPVVSTTFVEQFWMSAKSKIINNVRYITAKVAGNPVSILEASIRSDLLFDDADGIDSLPNQAIFDAIQLMGYERDLTKRVVNEEDTAKVPAEQEVTEQGTKKRKSGHVKMIARKRPRPQPDNDSDDEYRKCIRIITFESNIDSEIMETKSFIAKDLFHLYDLVMKQYSEITPEDIELILWGDLKIMMESSTEENVQGDFWNNQQEWEIVRWRLYEACGVCILEFKDGTVIYMLVERRYPLSKELLQQMLDLGLEVEEESTAALQLVRFIKQQLNEE